MNHKTASLNRRGTGHKLKLKTRKIKRPAYVANCPNAKPLHSIHVQLMAEIFYFFFGDGLWLLDMYERVAAGKRDAEPGDC